MNKYVYGTLGVMSLAAILGLASCDFPSFSTAEASESNVAPKSAEQLAEERCFRLSTEYVEWEKLLRHEPSAKIHMNLVHHKGKLECAGWAEAIKLARAHYTKQKLEQLGY